MGKLQRCLPGVQRRDRVLAQWLAQFGHDGKLKSVHATQRFAAATRMQQRVRRRP
jgi:hypothetical protein